MGRIKWPILPIKTFQVQDLIKRAILYNDVPNYIYYFLYFLVHSFMLALLCKSLNGHPEKAAALFADLVTINCFTGIIFCCRLFERYTFVPLLYPYFNIHKLESQIRLPKGHLIGSQHSVFFQKLLLLIDEFFIQMHSIPLFYISEFDNVVFMFMSTAKTGHGH